MRNIEQILKNQKITLNQTQDENFRSVSPEIFLEMFKKAIVKYFRHGSTEFIIDANNREIISQLYYFLVHNPKFHGNLDRGILLAGRIGSGKTLLMSAFLKVFDSIHKIDEYSMKGTEWIHAKELESKIQDPDFNKNKTRRIYIDDIGKEEIEVTVYGNRKRPFEDFIARRYEVNALTFGTTNLKIEDMEYNPHTKDRMIQMFNVFVLPGMSRRK